MMRRTGLLVVAVLACGLLVALARMLFDRWVALAVLTFARTAMGFQFQSVGAVSPLLMERHHIANTELGWLIGLFSLPGVFLALPGGLLGGRFGDRRVVLAGLGLMSAGSALMGAAEGFAAVVIGRLLSAVGAVLLGVVLAKMVTDWFVGREIIWAMTVLINAWPVGIGLASLTLPIVANAWGVPAVFHVAAGAAAVGGDRRDPVDGARQAQPPRVPAR